MNHTQESILFYRELGLAIAQWARVETALAQLVTLCIPPYAHDRWALYMGFFSIENFRSKLQFADTLILEKFKDSSGIDEWATLSDRLKSQGAFRNQLAHRLVVDAPFHRIGGKRFALIKAPKPAKVTGSPNRKVRKAEDQWPPQEAIFLRDIDRFVSEMHATYAQLINFSARVRGLPEPLAKSLEQAADPSTTQNLYNQMLAILVPPKKTANEKS